jgi:hypothetical protein
MSQKSHIVYPDIEIYLANVTGHEIVDWLATFLSEITLTRSSPDKNTCHYSARYLRQQEEVEIHFIIMEKACANFTSLWLKSSRTPWNSDLECARAATGHFPGEVRCSPGSWNPDHDNDEWISIQNGNETTCTWRS